MKNTRVIKLGGSLLLRRKLLDQVRDFYLTLQQRDPRQQTYLIVGGGLMIEAVRQWDHLRPGEPADVHWRCVEMLRHSFAFMRDAILADARWANGDDERFGAIETHEQWTGRNQRFAGNESSEFTLVNVPAFYRRDTASVALPENWQTTTDAIACYLAEQIDADECWLLKSCQVDQQARIEDWIQAGIIDSACHRYCHASFKLRPVFLSDQ